MVEQFAQARDKTIRTIELEMQLAEYPRGDGDQLRVAGIEKRQDVVHVTATPELIGYFVEAHTAIDCITDDIEDVSDDHWVCCSSLISPPCGMVRTHSSSNQ